MTLEQKPFIKYNLKEKDIKDTFTIRLNKDERLELDRCKAILEQPKDSTALKTLAKIGANVLQDNLTGYILRTVFINKRRNQRTGLIEFEEI